MRLAAGLLALAAAAAASSHDHCYTSPFTGLFAQEAGDHATLAPGVRQHPAFGARVPWPDVHARLAACGPACRLLLLVRHGEATSNAVQATVGPREWNLRVGRKCSYRGVPLWDAPLTAVGGAQAAALRAALADGPVTAADLLGPAAARPRAVSSPLRRCLNTTLLALGGGVVPLESLAVSELARERWGVNTCDGRHPVTPPGGRRGEAGAGDDAVAVRPEVDADGDEALSPHPNRPPCTVDTGLTALFGRDAFGGWPVVGDLVVVDAEEEEEEGTEGDDNGSTPATCRLPPSFGLVSDGDSLWTVRSRETPAHVRARARTFLDAVWAETAADGPAGAALFVVSHSGFIANLLDAMGREVYRAANAEVVPVLVRRGMGAECEAEEEWDDA
jgi:broad specificity phosphatase PhoE